jgi:signal transduction histidine kinase
VPLRIRLVLILVLLVAVALAAIEVITYNAIRSSSIATVDTQMKSSVSPWEDYFLTCNAGFCNPALSAMEGVQPDTFGAAYSLSGTPTTYAWRCTSCREAMPVLSKQYITKVAASNGTVHWETTVGTLGVHSFRVLTTVVQVPARFGNPGAAPYVLVVAFPLTAVNATMRHILILELVIGAAILAALAVMSWFLVRLGLLPLEQMARTASEIAAGDLTKRVEDADERTEVGQLGASLNVMLNQIERAFREREASEERLRRFVGDASHELRTPLTSIRGYAELFKGGVADRPEDLAAALGRIESESSRMGGLVDDLLLLARLDQGRPLGHDPVDLTQLAADAVQDAKIVDASRPISVVSTGACVVIGDEQRLRQVLGNLITNAVAYSPPGSPIEVVVHMDRAPAPESVPAGLTGLPGLSALSNRGGRSGRSARPLGPGAARSSAPSGVAAPLASGDLAVPPAHSVGTGDMANSMGPERPGGPGSGGTSLGDLSWGLRGSPGANGTDSGSPEPVPWPGTRASVAVIDHGPGIPAESRPYVFERFWRADPSRKRTSGGTGLGLAIVAAVVAAHGGQVTIRETPGGGATFVVELPAAPEVGNGSGPGEEVPE